LDHKVADDAMELGAFVAESHCALGQLEEVLRRFWDNIAEQANHNPSFVDAANGNVKIGFVSNSRILLLGGSALKRSFYVY
jgi:hypothetical protein